ncbi:MAG TPA: bifunctional diguanylate cyclase/phosphodiesterase, partial [Catenuloplanes sp.]
MSDESTDKQLRLLVGLVVVTALVCFGWSLTALKPLPPVLAIYPAVLIALIGVANGLAVQIRLRAQLRLISSTSAAVVVTIAMVPLPWAVLCTAAGVLAAKILTQRDARKISFNTAKDVIGVTVAAGVMKLTGIDPTTPAADPGLTVTDLGPSLLTLVPALCVAFVGYGLVDELLGSLVIATASRTTWGQMLRKEWDARILSRASSLFLGILTVIVIGQDRRLLIAMPPAVWALHLSSANRLRRRAEREAWRRLAQTTDELNVIELDAVLRCAVTRA